MSILVVDDTLEVREMLSVLLESAVYRDILFAESAAAAFERLGMGGSGAAEAGFLEAAFAAGAADYLTKPINRVELLARMRSALKLKREMDRRKAREQELEQALREVKVLQGLLPTKSVATCGKLHQGPCGGGFQSRHLPGMPG